mgnify:CR=1 FL=1
MSKVHIHLIGGKSGNFKEIRNGRANQFRMSLDDVAE